MEESLLKRATGMAMVFILNVALILFAQSLA